jgi:hypothetical protein
VQKTGALLTFTSYPAPGVPMHVECSRIPELADEPDFFEAVCEVEDIKAGNAVQMIRRELRYETTREGNLYDRPHYATIAQSKAYRNGVLALIPQDVQIQWKLQQLALGKDEVITGSVIEEKRVGVLQFAARKGIPLDRRAIEALTIEQITGLSEAVRGEGLDQFRASAQALGIVQTRPSEQTHPGLVMTASSRAPSAQSGGNAEPRQPRQDVQQQAAATDGPPAGHPANGPAEPSAPQQTQQQPTNNAQPSAGQQPQQPAPTFEAYVVDEFGELQMDGDRTAYYRDPVVFARSFVNRAMTIGNLPTFLENNADAIEDARKANPEAAKILTELDALVKPRPADGAGQQQAPQQTQEKVSRCVQLPQKGNRFDLAGYLVALKASADQITDLDDLTAWWTEQEPVRAKLPSVTKHGAEHILADRRSALSAPQQPQGAGQQQAQQQQPAAPQPSGPDWNVMAQGMLSDIRACKKLGDLDDIESNVAHQSQMRRLEAADAGLAQQIRDAKQHRRAEIAGGKP